jgi:hypothetical protein
MAGWRNLYLFDRFSQWSIHMNNPANFMTRFSQALLAVAVTAVSALVLQLAMLAA